MRVNELVLHGTTMVEISIETRAFYKPTIMCIYEELIIIELMVYYSRFLEFNHWIIFFMPTLE